MPLTLPPLSLYIHIPWCVRKCPYCDFNSHAAGSELPEAEYIAALLRDLERELEGERRPLHSIFIGGGTPSLFSAHAFEQLLSGVESRIAFQPDIEITMEANPGTFEQQRFADFRRAGINRLSIGIQSFSQSQLSALGRIHSGDEALRAVDIARNAGFENLNLDLMHGLPQQSLADAMADLQQAIDLAPEHLSWYQLTIEPNTEFYKLPPALPEDDTLVEIQEAGESLLAQHGYAHYEVSAFASKGARSQHNLNYWQFGDYIGIGAGAHGKLSRSDGEIIRRWKTRAPKDYLASDHPIAGERTLDQEELPLEFFMNALRLTEGVPAAFYAARTGQSLASIQPTLDALQQRGLLSLANDTIRPTEAGHRYLNELLMAFC